jgi:hypothetical protein
MRVCSPAASRSPAFQRKVVRRRPSAPARCSASVPARGGFPRVVAVGHGPTVEAIADVPASAIPGAACGVDVPGQRLGPGKRVCPRFQPPPHVLAHHACASVAPVGPAPQITRFEPQRAGHAGDPACRPYLRLRASATGGPITLCDQHRGARVALTAAGTRDALCGRQLDPRLALRVTWPQQHSWRDVPQRGIERRSACRFVT